MMHCADLNIPKCWVCGNNDSNNNCSIQYFRGRIKWYLHENKEENYDDAVKLFLVRQIKNYAHDTMIYLEKAIEIYYPQYLNLYNNISLLY